ncbi:beta-ketoacyl-[acyl-carrier-protein] synthase family protein [Testudinibacter sp. TR-2022]|uniref:beta-ketoacyl-[acyl-carrier-protein] synthase family protein n=1 Tax=Testudinibacter sp. TR-2022 TaxID=2585029 RepID=UPI0011191AA2|nr:beta-ketoacyl-[acyl-carrier-protein] synthase family protein [Testudinibacter sp. TR-2022]TNH06011.1 beta-ketoacyl-[acyl-carrier-protein] synthase family protein [Pasteurellaceae bacterium Phil11]TNH24288.1 beta-ketoacyl-[acyl-carrier-protein] synthase family protein [Testudinibacter sp. TR-2022]TNH26879.1 beta-ketoacyl-[acyl-carrier-protein] synthase family protein [Testudinibacter sp. TR-2022]
MQNNIFIQAYAMCNVLGNSKAEIWRNLQQQNLRLAKNSDYLPNAEVWLGHIEAELPPIPEELQLYDCRNNQVLAFCLQQLNPEIQSLIERFGRERIAIVMGTSTAGIEQGESYIQAAQQHKAHPNYHYRAQELGSISQFAANYLDIHGPNLTISTACSSSARVFITAERLLNSQVVDAVIVGGVDTLCHLTINGFHSLASISFTPNTPFSETRKGINIGEAGAVFVLSKEPAVLQLAATGESSDAHHISAPHPEGVGAASAMQQALNKAGLQPQDIGYLNLHGTGTPLNDSMESLAVAAVFGRVPCSSTKQLTGHTLGAAGATELGLACLLLEHFADQSAVLPLQTTEPDCLDPSLPPIGLITSHQRLQKAAVMSNSFAFGGNNTSLIVKRYQQAGD